MKIKVSLTNKKLLDRFWVALTTVSVITSLIAIFYDIPDSSKMASGLIFVGILVLIFIIMWLQANLLRHKVLRINNSTVEISVGDIFDENDLKVIAFNEYFDTIVDNKIIAASSLNGIYIIKNIDNLKDFDDSIYSDDHLRSKIVEENKLRESGKKNKYKLGTIFDNRDYLLTAFSHFNDDNMAFLTMSDYLGFWINFWNELDRVYAGRNVSIPLLGSGITRFSDYEMISDQELLEIILWTFKLSRVKFTYPSRVKIIIDKEKVDKINLFNIKEC